MKVLYDYTAFDMQTHGGVSRCFAELYPRLPKEFSAKVGVMETNNVYLQQLGFNKSGGTYQHFISQRNFFSKRFLFKLYYNFYYRDFRNWDHMPKHNYAYSIKLLKEQDFDIFHPTFFHSYFLKYLGHKPFVLTVHDMIPELYPQYYPSDNSQIVQKKILLPKAAHIIAVSETTKKDIIRLTNIPEEKITVIYHGASTKPYIPSSTPLFDFPYILYVGDRDLYKNFLLFSKYCLPILRRHPEINIVCTGKDFNTQELDFFKRNGVVGRFIHQFVATNQMMFDLYHNALTFVYPSEYEGFGIPILEAYKADCLLMLNRASCFPEIADDAAVYFYMDENSSDFEFQFENLYRFSKDEKERLIKRQRERLKLFSWQEAAEKLSRVYERVIYEHK